MAKTTFDVQKLIASAPEWLRESLNLFVLLGYTPEQIQQECAKLIAARASGSPAAASTPAASPAAVDSAFIADCKAKRLAYFRAEQDRDAQIKADKNAKIPPTPKPKVLAQDGFEVSVLSGTITFRAQDGTDSKGRPVVKAVNIPDLSIAKALMAALPGYIEAISKSREYADLLVLCAK